MMRQISCSTNHSIEEKCIVSDIDGWHIKQKNVQRKKVNFAVRKNQLILSTSNGVWAVVIVEL
jgi:hypothetical protein